MIRVILLGAGNVGTHLSLAFVDSTAVDLLQVYSRSKKSLEGLQKDIPVTTNLSKLKEADVYIIAVPDDAIAKLSDKLDLKNKLVVHTSGGTSMSVLSDGNRKGVFYPLQTFSRNTEVDISEVPICIEAERPEDLKLLADLGSCISNKVSVINSEERTKLHLAAVFVNNFANHMYSIADSYLEENDLPFELLKPLIQETAHKISEINPHDAQTGPAKRDDKSTIKKHLNLLKDSPYRDLYQRLSDSIENTYGKKL